MTTLSEMVKELAYSDRYKTYYVDLLLELLAIDTTPKSDISIIRENEHKAFEIITRELQSIDDNIIVERIPIDEAIESHPYFTQAHYTKTDDSPQGLSVRETYSGRYNLVAVVKGANESGGGHKAIYNSHIDTVAPNLEVRVDGNLIYGRGACDAKGQVALMLTQIKLLAELGEPINQDRVYQFVIDEEPGGNGSVSLAIDTRFKDASEVIAFEITSNKAHPANRGALWYKVELDSFDTPSATQPKGSANPRINVAEMQAYIVLALEAEGRQIKSESDHPLFPTRPVQTCQGILGEYGVHPSAVNDNVGFNLKIEGLDSHQLRGIIDDAVRAYCDDYGDKTQEIDSVTGKPKVEKHYTLIEHGSSQYELEVHGKSGHMGAILECDDAITKGAYIVKAFKDYQRENSDVSITVTMGQRSAKIPPTPLCKGGKGGFSHKEDDSISGNLILEGGQGFIPTHTIEEVQERLSNSVTRGAQEYCRLIGVEYKPEITITTYEKLHNDAYVSPVDCPAMQAMQGAFDALGLDFGEPTAWLVSCDARIFAREGYNVVTFGPGALSDAHQPGEKIDITQAQEAVVISALAALNVGNTNY